MEITVENLLTKIGSLSVQIDALTMENQQLREQMEKLVGERSEGNGHVEELVEPVKA